MQQANMRRLRKWLSAPALLSPNKLGIFQACLIGAVAGISAGLLAQGVALLGSTRLMLLRTTGLSPYMVLPTFGLLGGFIAGWLVQDFAPEATGSGIPQVKAALARVKVALDMPTGLAKLLGGTLSLGSGLFMGREGPTVHVCACLAAEINKVVPTTPEQRRQLIAAGAGAGLAAAFHAPIAGVMFVLEELLRDISSATIGTAVLASFVGAVTSSMLHSGRDVAPLEKVAQMAHFNVIDIPWYVVIGVFSGIAGAVFNRSVLLMLGFFRDRVHLPLALKVGIAGLISGLIIACLPGQFDNYAGMREAITSAHADPSAAGVAFVVFFVLTVVAYGSGAPGGLFAPSLSIGSALGFGIGVLAMLLNHQGDPRAFAIAGMGGMFASVARVPVTAIIIIFEMSRSFDLVLPLMIVCIIASNVAERLYPESIYDRLMDWGGIKPKEDQFVKEVVLNRVAEDIMTARALTLSTEEPIKEALERISVSKHERFPVLSPNGKLVGIVSNADFEMLARSEVGGDSKVEQIMTPQPVSVPAEEPLSNVLFLFEHYKLTMLPVLRDDRLIGVITRSDLIHTIYAEAGTHASTGKHSRLAPAASEVVTISPNPSETES